MRLAIISDCIHVQTPQGKAGSDVHIFVRQMEALSKYFSEVHICCPFVSYNSTVPITTYTNNQIFFIPLKKVGGSGIKAKVQLLQQIPLWLKAFKKANNLSDIVYQRFPNNVNIPGFFYFYFINKKVFATYTGTWLKNKEESITYTFQKWLLKHFFKGPVGVYNHEASTFKHVFNSFSPSYSEVEWQEETQQVNNKIEQLQHAATVPLTMVTVGSFVEYKNQQYILNTCLKLQQNNIPYHLYLVGDGELMNEYKNFIAINNMQYQVTFTGKLTFTEVRKIYRQVNFVVQSPLVEGFGKVPIEGYFHGALPVINDIAMSNYITQQNTLGCLFTVNNTDGLYNVLVALKDKPLQVAERIQQARLFAKQFTLEAWANAYYQQIILRYPQLK
jgi:glycosyltransferase involved in cell wall biosynthesis